MEQLWWVFADVLKELCIVYIIALHSVHNLYFLDLSCNILSALLSNGVSQRAQNMNEVSRVYVSDQLRVVLAKCLFRQEVLVKLLHLCGILCYSPTNAIPFQHSECQFGKNAVKLERPSSGPRNKI